MHPILRQLQQHVNQAPLAEKILFCRSHKEGNALIETLTASGIPSLNLRTETFPGWLEKSCHGWLLKENRKIISPEVSWFLIKEICVQLKDKNQLTYFHHTEISHGMVTALQEAVLELRRGLITSREIKPGTFITPEKSKDLQLLLTAYEKRLEREGWADELMLFLQLNKQQIPLVASARYLILPEKAPCPIYQKLTTAMLTNPNVHLLTHTGETPKPAHAFIQSNGQWNETRDLLNYIKNSEVPLDQTLILTTSQEPYTTLLAEQSQYRELSITFGNGIAITLTGPGALFRMLLNWLRYPYQRTRLSAMLRSGNIQIPETGLDAEGLEHLLQEYKINPFRYSASEWIPAITEWLHKFSRIRNDKDGEAKKILLEQLRLMGQYMAAQEDPKEILEYMEKKISALRVAASSPKPGSLHLDSVESGLITGRSLVMVAGLDARSFPGTPKEGPILLDSEREKWENFPLKRDDPGLRENQLINLTSHHEGTLVYSYSAYNPLEHRSESPSAFLLNAYRLYRQDPDIGYESMKEKLKSDGGYLCWASADTVNIKETLQRHYPNICQGRQAFRLRQEASLNEYNGKIHVQPREVDPRHNEEILLSATQLEQLAKCPYIYFLQRLLGVYPLEEVDYKPDTWLSAKERGSLLHAVYDGFYREILEKNIWHQRDLWKPVLKDNLNRQLKFFRELVPPPGDRIYQREADELTEAVYYFWRLEEEHHLNQQPVYLELKLGMEEEHPVLGSLPPSVFSMDDGRQFRFRGAVDRIDLVAPNQYEIMDYKTGSTYGYSLNKPFDEGRRLQHALYSKVVENLLKEKVSREAQVVQSGYYFPTPKGQGEKYMYHPLLCSGEQNPLHRILTLLLDAVATGTFVDWGDMYHRQQEDYGPIMDQNPDESTRKAMLENVKDPDLEKLLEVKNYD